MHAARHSVEATFAGSEGPIFYRRWGPEATPDRIVLIVHGYAEHGGRYAHVAAALVERGAVVYAADHLGHGRSHGERALITDFEHVVDDLHTLAGIARTEHPGLPLFLVGHSMGGLLCARFAQRWPDEVAGIAFCGSVIGDWRWAREVLAQPGLPHIPFDPEALSRDPQAGAAYAADPLVYHGQYKRGLLEAEVEALDRFAQEIDRLTMPVAFLHGTDDPFVPYERSLQAVREMPTSDLTVHVYEGARHELLNETNNDEVIGHLCDWSDRICATQTLRMARPFVPADFAVPLGLEGAGFRLEPLGPEHNERDHEAWMSSIDHIRATPGFADRDWPRPMSLADNLADLEGHARDFGRRTGFTYSVLDGDQVIGCVYIYPSRSDGHDAAVSSWVRQSRREMDVIVWRGVSGWLSTDWPFSSPEYAARDDRDA